MTQYEFIDVLALWMSLGLGTITLYLTIVSGHIVLALSVGKQLGRYQAIFITDVFVIFAGFFTAGTYMFWANARSFVIQNPDFGFQMSAFWGTLISGAEFMGIVGALFFMRSTRK